MWAALPHRTPDHGSNKGPFAPSTFWPLLHFSALLSREGVAFLFWIYCFLFFVFFKDCDCDIFRCLCRRPAVPGRGKDQSLRISAEILADYENTYIDY